MNQKAAKRKPYVKPQIVKEGLAPAGLLASIEERRLADLLVAVRDTVSIGEPVLTAKGRVTLAPVEVLKRALARYDSGRG